MVGLLRERNKPFILLYSINGASIKILHKHTTVPTPLSWIPVRGCSYPALWGEVASEQVTLNWNRRLRAEKKNHQEGGTDAQRRQEWEQQGRSPCRSAGCLEGGVRPPGRAWAWGSWKLLILQKE